MKRTLSILLILVLAVGLFSCKDIKGTRGKPGGLGVGDRAYEFKLMDANGNWVRMSDVQEGWYLVLVLFRGSWCEACLTQLTRFKQDIDRFSELKAGIACASVEPVSDLAEFQRQWRFPFPILADPQLRLTDAYGARHPKGHGADDISRPCVVIIDPDRIVRYKYIGANPHDHPHNAEILSLIRKFKAVPPVQP